ncbi:MAG: hypothetical protein ACPGQF_07010, partial [Akkermansiaceae bacterium]
MSQKPPPIPAPVDQGFKQLRWILVIAFLIGEFALISVALRGAVPPDEARDVSGYSPWSEEVLEIAEAIPVQEGGRIKPLRTYARFKMMSFHGSLTMKVKSGGKVHEIGPVAWLLDCMFR